MAPFASPLVHARCIQVFARAAGPAFFTHLRNLRDRPLDTTAAGPNTPTSAQFRGRAQNGAVWTFGVKSTF